MEEKPIIKYIVWSTCIIAWAILSTGGREFMGLRFSFLGLLAVIFIKD